MVDSLKGVYWKSYRRGLQSPPFLEHSYIAASIATEAPGGQGLVEYKNVSFQKTDGTQVKIQLNHHCNLDEQLLIDLAPIPANLI